MRMVGAVAMSSRETTAVGVIVAMVMGRIPGGRRWGKIAVVVI